MSKKKKSTISPIEKTLSLAGTAVVAFGSAASIYYAIINERFIYDISQSIYYLNYLIMLGGGFAAGYLLARKASRVGKLFVGSTYALTTITIWLLLDAFRILSRSLLGNSSMMFDIVLFQYSPLIALAITIILAFFFQYRSKQSSLTTPSKYALIGTFLASQLYNVGYIIYLYATMPSSSNVTSPLWLDIASIVTHPVFIAFVTFLLLGRVKSRALRFFYAAFIAQLTSIFMYTLWNFRVDPTLEATLVFQFLSFILAFLLAAILIWRVRVAHK